MGLQVFVINLKSSSDRMENTHRQLEQAGIKYRLVEAVDGRGLPDDYLINNPDFGIFKTGVYSRYLRKEEIGCTLSHLKIFRQIIDDHVPAACILEDDNDYSPDFGAILEMIEQNHSNWDLLYLGHRSVCITEEATGQKNEKLHPSDYFIGEPFEVPYGSHGYIITNSAAGKLLENAYPIKAPIDVYLGNSAAMGIRTMLLQPPCIVSDSRFLTTIQDENTIVVKNRFSGVVRNLLRKNRLIFRVLKNSTIKFRILRNSALRSLRKNGLISNNYARILK